MNDGVDEQRGLNERLQKVENHLRVAVLVAGIFGVSGIYGASILRGVKQDLDKVSEKRDELIKSIERAGRLAITRVDEAGETNRSAILAATASALTSIKTEAQQAVSKAFSQGFSGDLMVSENKWGPGGEHGFGNGAHIHTNKVASCPEGTFVSGVRVEYGGTCGHHCDGDGGIIRNIVLDCRSL